MPMKLGQFSEKSIDTARELTSQKMNFSESEMEALDFARCQRPDGSYYGTSGQCRKGTPVEAKKFDEKKLKAANFDQLKRLSQAGQLDADTRGQIKEELANRKESSILMKLWADRDLNPEYELTDEESKEISDFYVSVNKAVDKKVYKGNNDQAKADYLTAVGRDLWDLDDKVVNNANGEKYQAAYTKEFDRQHITRYGKKSPKKASNLAGGSFDWYNHLGWNDGINAEDIAFG